MELNKDVLTVITWTFAVVILAWLLLNAGPAGNLATSASSSYGSAVKAILPANG